jgi:hypothetical protein
MEHPVAANARTATAASFRMNVAVKALVYMAAY